MSLLRDPPTSIGTTVCHRVTQRTDHDLDNLNPTWYIFRYELSRTDHTRQHDVDHADRVNHACICPYPQVDDG